MATNSYCVILPHFLDMKYPKMSKLLPILSGFRLRKHFRESQRLLLGVPVNAGYSITGKGQLIPQLQQPWEKLHLQQSREEQGRGFLGIKQPGKGSPSRELGDGHSQEASRPKSSPGHSQGSSSAPLSGLCSQGMQKDPAEVLSLELDTGDILISPSSPV